jgi:two-component system, chemotaxis family, sensor kinase Cph1
MPAPASLLRGREDIQLEERRRLARDIHDHLGQHLTALRMQLEHLHSQCAAHPAVLVDVVKAQGLAQALDRDLDLLIAQLRPPALPEGDFARSLSMLVDSWSQRFGIAGECLLSDHAARRLPKHAAENLYAIAEEALHNVVKHASATRVNLSLSESGGRIVLLIEDDGCGFSVSKPVPGRSGFGLVSMRERAELAGGDFEIESSPGGTAIYVRIPPGRADRSPC